VSEHSKDLISGIPDHKKYETTASSLLGQYSQFQSTIQANSATVILGERDEGMNALPQTVRTIRHNRGIGISAAFPTEEPQLILAAMPAFNEEKYIAKTIVLAKKYVTDVLVVDDGSKDATVEIARALGAIVVRHPKNQGYGAALKSIFDTARSLNADQLVILDADGQHNPNDIPNLLEPLKDGIDVVIGSRFLETNGSGIPTYRKAGMKVLDMATMVAGGINVSDTQSGFRAYGKRAIDAIQIHDEGMAAGSEILLRIKENDLKVGEVPIVVRYDLGDTSSQGPVSHGLGVLNQLVKVISYKKPMWFFGLPGAALAIFGLIIGSWAFSEYYATSKFPYLPSMVSGLALIIGLLLITSGLILNSLVTIIQSNK
jgi:glycosyltransferase involved in cell wall biosynthesis